MALRSTQNTHSGLTLRVFQEHKPTKPATASVQFDTRPNSDMQDGYLLLAHVERRWCS